MTQGPTDSSTSVFSSVRERRLWCCLLAVVFAIFSTLRLTPLLAEYFRDSVWLAVAFLLGMFLVASTILTQGLKTRPSGLGWGVGLGVATVFYMVLVRMAIPEQRSHLIEYGVVGVIVYEALAERASHRDVRHPGLLAAAIATLVGVTDECIQFLLPNRVFELQDILFNSLACVTAVAASVMLGWMRRRF